MQLFWLLDCIGSEGTFERDETILCLHKTEYVFDEAVFYALCRRDSLLMQSGTGSVRYLRKGGTGMYRRYGYE